MIETRKHALSALVLAMLVLLCGLLSSAALAGERLTLHPAHAYTLGGERIQIRGSVPIVTTPPGLERPDTVQDDANPHPSAGSWVPSTGTTPVAGIEDAPDAYPFACYDSSADCTARMVWACGENGPGGDHGGVSQSSFNRLEGTCTATCGDGSSVSCSRDEG